jgi:hypothetical protein
MGAVIMSIKNRGSGELDFTRAAHDEQADAELNYNVVLHTRLAPSLQRGVWAIETSAYSTDDERHRRPLVRQVDYWPSAATVSFSAALYQHLHKLVRMLEARHSDEQKAQASRW